MMDLNMIHYRQPAELLARLERDADKELTEQGKQLVAWHRAQEGVPELEAVLAELAEAAERTAEKLAAAEAQVPLALDELDRAQVALVKAEERDQAAKRAQPTPMMTGGVYPDEVPMQQSGGYVGSPFANETAAAELRLSSAQRALKRAQIDVGIARGQSKDAQDRVRGAQRILAGFEALERPETPTLGLLFKLMKDGE